MRRRLDLARHADAGAATVLFLDEPTTGSTPGTAAEVWAAIRGLVAGGTTVHAHHPVPRRGRPARRPHRGHRRRAGHRRGHATEAQGPQVGGDRIDVVGTEGADLGAVVELVARATVAEALTSRGGPPGQRPGRPQGLGAHRGGPGPWRTRASWSTTSACGGRRSTTCSSSSRGAAPCGRGARRPVRRPPARPTGGRGRRPRPPRPAQRGGGMSATTLEPRDPAAGPGRGHGDLAAALDDLGGPLVRLRWAARDGWLVAGRDMAQWLREPPLIVWGLCSPSSRCCSSPTCSAAASSSPAAVATASS